MDKPTRKALQEKYDQGPDAMISYVDSLFDSFAEQFALLQQRIEKFEHQKAKDSHNSSKPPSSDGLKKRPTSLRSLQSQKTRNRAGGQQGHKGATLKRVSSPDHTETLAAPSHCSCGYCLDKVEVQGHDSRQVFDIPPRQLEVTELNAEIKKCPVCQSLVKAAFPEYATKAAQYGPNIIAHAVYLMNQHLIPYGRTSEILQDFYNAKISTGTLFRFNKMVFDILEKPVAAIKNKLSNSAILHVDETGCRVEKGVRHWIHTAATKLLTYYFLHQKRGAEGIDAMDILPDFEGVAVHDHFKPYLRYSCNHAECNAHILRELIFLVEQKKQKWAEKMLRLLLKIKKKKEQAQNKELLKLPDDTLQDLEQQYLEILEQGCKENPEYPAKRKRFKRTEAQRLLRRLKEFKDSHLAFMYDFNIPFDNNLAERDIRMVKLHQKISGCFRAEQGAEIFCRIRSFISTARKHAYNRLHVIKSALENEFPVFD